MSWAAQLTLKKWRSIMRRLGSGRSPTLNSSSVRMVRARRKAAGKV
jgi:hypothetical protein